MSEYRTLLSGWPDWARLAYLCALVPLFAVALVFDFMSALWCLLGPGLIIQTWINRNTVEYSRSQKPWLFWGSIGIFGMLTVVAAFELYQRLTEAPL